jgi:hypothetical protein
VAKSKSTNSARPTSSSSTKRKSAPSDNGPTTAAKKSSSVATSRGFSADDIGHVAGDVWGLLSGSGGQTLAAIKKSVSAPPDIVAAAIGWLAREGKLEFAAKGRQVVISLR